MTEREYDKARLMVNRAEQVQRVLDARIITTYIDTSDMPWSHTMPLFEDTEASRKFIRRVLAAAEGRRQVFPRPARGRARQVPARQAAQPGSGDGLRHAEARAQPAPRLILVTTNSCPHAASSDRARVSHN